VGEEGLIMGHSVSFKIIAEAMKGKLYAFADYYKCVFKTLGRVTR